MKLISEIPSFESILTRHHAVLERSEPRILQINVGKLCNLSCVHCHVGAGPNRREIIRSETVDRILAWYDDNPLPVVDLTGGAPEMAPDFTRMVRHFRKRGAQILDRCNLTILLQPGYEDMAAFLKEQSVEIVASMPCYSPENVNAQRGEGVFDDSIRALTLLNKIGYGIEPDLPLHLVYNPNGAFLPPPQAKLEAVYKRELFDHFGIRFQHLYCLTNLPVARYASYLRQHGEYESYMDLLLQSFNPASVQGLMCRDTLSVDWRGRVFDCDFNQQLNLHPEHEPRFLWDLDLRRWRQTPIRTAQHCYGCTAGCGSSCGGSLV